MMIIEKNLKLENIPTNLAFGLENRLCVPLCDSRWQFASDGADIGFGVYRRTERGQAQKVAEMLQVLPSERYNAHLVPEDSCLTCPEPGVCKWPPTNIHRHREHFAPLHMSINCN